MTNDTPNPQVTLATPHGDIVVELDVARAPLSARHFQRLVEDGLLDGAAFYRVTHPDPTTTPPMTIDIIQGGVGWDLCGDLPSVGHESTSATGLRHADGVISYARGADQDATSEFFICLGDQPILDARPDADGPAALGFAAFGRVVQGMDVVRAIHDLPADGPPPGGDERFVGQFLTEPVPLKPRR